MTERAAVKAADLTEIRRAITLFFSPGDVVEIRALDVRGKTLAGYFSDHEKLANEAARLSGTATGVYVVLNRINRDLLARSANRVTVGPKNTTQDTDVTRRVWLPIDVDSNRPKGISSTNPEHEGALIAGEAVKSYLIELGFPADSIIGIDSGNGAHVPARIDLPNDADAETLVKSCLKAVAAKFDSDKVTIDQSVFNASRIWKLPGTLAKKGDSTASRPHRLARILSAPQSLTIAPREALERLAATAPVEVPKAPTQRQTFDLMVWLQKYNIEIVKSGNYKDGTRHILHHCPFNPDHASPDATIIQGIDGQIGFKCLHNSCRDKKWSDVRELFEPGYKERQRPYLANTAPVPPAGPTPLPPFDWRKAALSHNSLMAKDLPPISSLVKDLIPKVGVTEFAGKKKIGKSWLMLQLSQSVASGSQFLNRDTLKNHVVHLALEDGEARLKQRLIMQNAAANEDILYLFKWPPFNSRRGFDALVDMIDEERPGLLVVDTLPAALSGKLDQNDAGSTGELFNRIHALALEKGVSIVLVGHHGKRQPSGDVGFDIRGSSAVPGATDCNIGLYRNADGTCDLKAESRDFGEVDMRIIFDADLTWCWHYRGEGQDLRQLEAETKIKDAIQELGGRADVYAIAQFLDMNRVTVQYHVKIMRERGTIGSDVCTDKTTHKPRIIYIYPLTTSTILPIPIPLTDST